MEEREYIVVSSEEPEVITPKEIVYESTVVAPTEEIHEVSVEENIYEAAVIPEVPKVIGEEQLYVYVSPLDSAYKNKVDNLEESLEEVKNNIPSKTSDLNNDGDGNSPFATEDYVEKYGGKIDSISLNGNEQTIDENKNVNLIVTTESIGAATKQDVDNIKKVIPNQASETNQLADKDFVNSSIETATAVFKGTYTDLDVLRGIQADKNDYAFYDHYVEGNRTFDKYKYDGIQWSYENSLYYSSYTVTQWKAINSGISTESINQILTSIENINNVILNIQGDVSNLNQQIERALKTPVSAPNETKVVGIDETNSQVLIPLNELGGSSEDCVTTNTEQDILAYKDFLQGLGLNNVFDVKVLEGSTSSNAIDPRELKDGFYYFPDRAYIYVQPNTVMSLSHGIFFVTTKINGGEGKCWLWFGEYNGGASIIKGYITSTNGVYEEIKTSGFIKTGASLTQNISCSNSSKKSVLSLTGYNINGTFLDFVNFEDGIGKTCSIGINGNFKPVFIDKDGNENSLDGGYIIRRID